VGQELVGIGSVIGPALLGVLASQGIETVFAHPRPRVGVLSTGNELSDSRDDLGDGKIRDANRPTLLASLARSGFTPVDLGIAGDTPTPSPKPSNVACVRATRLSPLGASVSATPTSSNQCSRISW